MEAEKKGLFSWYFQSNLLNRILWGLILGSILGICLGAYADPATIKSFVANTKVFGDLFIRLLKMIVVPVVFLSLVTGAASIAPSHLGRVGFKTLIFYLATSAFAVTIGLVLATLVSPGEGFSLVGGTEAKVAARTAPPLTTVLLNIIPTNPVQALANGDILAIILFAITFGIALSLVKDSGDSKVAQGADFLLAILSAGANVMYKVVAGIMHYAPIGVLFLIANVFAVQGPQAVGTLFLVTATVYIGLIIQLFIVYSGSLQMFGLSPVAFIKNAGPPMITAFVTRSSSGTLPITLKTCDEKFGVPGSVSSFTLPLGATVNMDGTAIYLGVCAMFIGFAVGSPLTFDQQLIVVVTATLASIGTAGVPGAGAIMLLMVMDTIGMPITAGSETAAAYAIVLGIDALLDMGRTSLNVAGDMVGTILVSKSEKSLDMAKWQKS